ncbi:protein GRIP [Silene latifolia]|uniref:protein GRIP n=1 Tax=Silene latifolia TaxID=37657 RepID=UPI003D771E72
MTEKSAEIELELSKQLLSDMSVDSSDDQLVGLIVENEFLRSQIRGFQFPNEGVDSTEDVKVLQKKIELLDSQLDEEKQTRAAAEQALEYLRQSFSEADARAQDLSLQLAQANQKLEQEIKERDDKYAELDSKFTRLHKRAKQRIQDVQKEKDDLEAQFRDANERAERASSEISGVKQELDRARQQASEALKTLDAERQQLRSMNNKLRDNIEELRHSLEPKEHALETLQQSLLEKDQMLDNMQSQLQASEEKKQASIAELTVKHQKRLESLEMQLGEAMSEQNRAAETISSLKVLVAEKSSKIAELDSALSGESARLKAAIKSVEGELAHEKQERVKEKEKWEATSQTLKAKLQTAESNCIRAEIETAKIRSQLQLQLSTQAQKLNDQDAELAASREQIRRLEAEFSAYKVRAHSLLQKKDAELAAVKDSDQVKALEEALKEAENEISLACSERDKAVHELRDAMTNFEKELSTRDASRKKADQLLRDLEMKLDSQARRHQSEKEAWELNLRNLEETWREKYERLKSENETSQVPDVTQEMEALKLQYRRLKEEQDSFHDLADRMIEEKDKDISRLLNENKKLQQSLDLKLNGSGDVVNTRALQNEDSSMSFLAEDQILILARQQAQREEELAQSQRHILALQAEIEELERENQLRSQQESMLKEELRSMDRAQKREGLDLTYLKNVLLKLLETGEVEALLPVIAMLLQFSPEEIQKCQQAYTNYADASPSPNSANDTSSSSLFSRFAFG